MKDDKSGFLKWKLKDKPTVEDVTTLMNVGILTKDEARKIILEQTEDVRQSDIEAIKDEIKLLRKIVLENSRNNPIQIVEIIRKEIQEVPYRWTMPYSTYCSITDSNMYNSGGGGGADSGNLTLGASGGTSITAGTTRKTK